MSTGHTHDPGNPVVNETGEVCTNESHYKTKDAGKSVSVDDSAALTGAEKNAEESSLAEEELQEETSETKKPAKLSKLRK